MTMICICVASAGGVPRVPGGPLCVYAAGSAQSARRATVCGECCGVCPERRVGQCACGECCGVCSEHQECNWACGECCMVCSEFQEDHWAFCECCGVCLPRVQKGATERVAEFCGICPAEFQEYHWRVASLPRVPECRWSCGECPGCGSPVN